MVYKNFVLFFQMAINLAEHVALYHGTTDAFVRQARGHGLASGSRTEPLYLTQSVSSAAGYAVDRARSYQSQPVLVVVAVDRVVDRVFEEDSQLRIEYIAAEEGILYQFSVERKLEPDDIGRMGNLFREKFGVLPPELVVPHIRMISQDDKSEKQR